MELDRALAALRAHPAAQSEILAALQACLSTLSAAGSAAARATTNYLLNEGLAELLHDLVLRHEGGGPVQKIVRLLLQELHLSDDQGEDIISPPSHGAPLLNQRRLTMVKQGLGRKRPRPKSGQRAGPLVAGMTGSGGAYSSFPLLHQSSPARLPIIESATGGARRGGDDGGDLRPVGSRHSQQPCPAALDSAGPSIASLHSSEVDPALDRSNNVGFEDALEGSTAPPHAAGTLQHSVSYLDDCYVEGSFYGYPNGTDDPTLPVRLWRGGIELGARSRLILDIYRNEGTRKPTLLSAHVPMITVHVCDLTTGQTYLVALSESQLGQASLLPDVLRMHQAPPDVQVSHIERLVEFLGLRLRGGGGAGRKAPATPRNWDESTILGDSIEGAASSNKSVVVKQWDNLEDQTLNTWRRRMAEQRAREEREAAKGVPKLNAGHNTPDERLRTAIQRQRLEMQKSIEKSRPKSPTAKVFVAVDNKRTDIVVDFQASLLNIEPIKVAPDIVDTMLALCRSLDPLDFGFVATAQFKLVLTLTGSVLTPKEVRAIIEQYGIKHPDGVTSASGSWKPEDGMLADTSTPKEHEEPEGGEEAQLEEGTDAKVRAGSAEGMQSLQDDPTFQETGGHEEQMRKKRERDDQHGVSPQAIAATVAAARLRSRTEREAAWPLDYERFCLSGRLVRLHGMDKNVPPVAPWAEKLKKNKIEAPAEELTWGAHVRRFQQRRMIAVTWLLKRGLRAQRHFINTSLVFQQLKVTAIRAGAFVFIRDKAHKALRHEDKKRNARSFLAERRHRVKRHRNLHAETFRLLKKLVQKQIANNRANNFEASNQNRCWMRQYHTRQAHKWLAAKAAVQKRRYIEKTQAYQWLRALGKMATISRQKIDREQVLIETMGRRALVQSARRHTAFQRNLVEAAKATDLWYDQYAASEWLYERALFTLTHLENQAGAFAYLKRLGDGGVRFIFRGQLAQQWLTEAGYSAIKHNQAQYDARAYLKRIQDGAAGVVGGQDAAFQWLVNFVERSFKHLRKCGKAKASLNQSVLMARKHKVFMGRAKMELQQMVEETRVNAEMAALGKQNPQRLSKLVEKVKAADKRKAAERKSLPPLGALKLEMQEAFDIFDLDASGEIDRVEFAHLLRGGALFKLKRDEIDDVYTQIDKDRSGAVDFEEFWAWCQYEFSKTPQRKVKVSMIMPAKERAMRLLLLEHRQKDDASRSPLSPTAWLDSGVAIERSPTKERLRQEKKRFLDADEDDLSDASSVTTAGTATSPTATAQGERAGLIDEQASSTEPMPGPLLQDTVES